MGGDVLELKKAFLSGRVWKEVGLLASGWVYTTRVPRQLRQRGSPWNYGYLPRPVWSRLDLSWRALRVPAQRNL